MEGKNPFDGKIKQIQKHLKMTQAEFTKTLGLSRPGLSRLLYDGGKPSFDVLDKFHRELGVDLNWLVSDNGQVFGESEPMKGKSEKSNDDQDLKIQLVKKDLESAKMEIAYLKRIISDKEAIIKANEKGSV